MLYFFIAVAIAYVYAAAARPILLSPTPIGRVFAVAAAVALLLDPLLIPADQMVLRGLAEFVCADLMFKLIDYSRQLGAWHGQATGFADYLRFLIPFPVLLGVFGRREKRLLERPSLLPEIAIVGSCSAIVAAAFVAVDLARRLPVLQSSFPLDHAVKVALFLILIEAGTRAIWGLERLAGFDTKPIIERMYLAVSPGDFWRRYNRRVGDWLYLNVFRPSGGRRAPVRGIFATFFVSALFHELAFSVATSRFTGYQFTFFMLQAPAVAISQWLQPFIEGRRNVVPPLPDGRGPPTNNVAAQIAARVMTVLWFYGTSVFFFEGVARVFPFVYASHPWLP